MMFATREHAEGWLAGMIDGEGSVGYKQARRSRYASISNTDWKLILACEEALSFLGVTFRTRSLARAKSHWKPAWEILVTGRENLERLADLPLQGEKRARLDAQLASYRRGRKPTRDELERRYTFNGESISDLAKAYRTRRATVGSWLEEYQIPVRTLSCATQLGWAKR